MESLNNERIRNLVAYVILSIWEIIIKGIIFRLTMHSIYVRNLKERNNSWLPSCTQYLYPTTRTYWERSSFRRSIFYIFYKSRKACACLTRIIVNTLIIHKIYAFPSPCKPSWLALNAARIFSCTTDRTRRIPTNHSQLMNDSMHKPCVMTVSGFMLSVKN